MILATVIEVLLHKQYGESILPQSICKEYTVDRRVHLDALGQFLFMLNEKDLPRILQTEVLLCSFRLF